MAISDNTQVNSSTNQIDADNLYGLNNPNPNLTNQSCALGTCPPNSIDLGYYIPSLAEIASYNLSAPAIGYMNQNSMQQNQSYDHTSQSMSSPIQQTPAAGNSVATQEVITSQELPDTPATVLNYGATMATSVRQDLGMGIADVANPYPVTPESIQYLNGFIRTQIGRRVTIDFLVGSDNLVSKSGYLLGVAQNYILINELDTNDITTCDFYNIKFIRFYY